MVPRGGREQSCSWLSFSVPFTLNFSFLYWLVLVIACVCVFWLLHWLLHQSLSSGFVVHFCANVDTKDFHRVDGICDAIPNYV